ncbi:MAG: glycosyltransferase [Chloroflexi bacterium]|nr:glycosyltransferase [Chloroflexota bacterium]
MQGVSIVIPAYNVELTLRECLQSVTTLGWDGEVEVIVVDDGSTDKTAGIAASFAGVKVIPVSHGGAARATNIGIKAARHNIVVLFDADAVPEKDWLEKIIPSLADPSVGAVAGLTVTANRSVIGRIAGYDVEWRIRRISGDTDHLSTMNLACRREVLLEVGLLTEELRAGYDADLSRRLRAASYRLILRKDVSCRHYWKDDLRGYIHQQYNYAYYRMEMTRRFGKPHDRVAGLGMVLQVPFTILTLLFAVFGSLVFLWAPLAILSLPLIHLPETFSLLSSRKETSVILLPLLFTMRSLVWVWGAVRWGIKSRAGQK